MNKKQFRYEMIVQEKLGKEKIFEIEQIKEEQCLYCNVRNTKQCRMTIQNNKCINYRRKRK